MSPVLLMVHLAVGADTSINCCLGKLLMRRFAFALVHSRRVNADFEL